ncbi:hypothetical protein E2C01_077064 [Portunus trituberculatus]|uniref:Uncharacterized protein n=1 Tax=Portunus trituberculatus TaxID=210409 RepID=A0A5B7IL86_PORTR|nr:hypothetical protein [Portunus trituberculatus]
MQTDFFRRGSAAGNKFLRGGGEEFVGLWRRVGVGRAPVGVLLRDGVSGVPVGPSLVHQSLNAPVPAAGER